MLELHGWVTIVETYRVTEEDNIDTIIEKIKREIDKLLYFKPQIKVQNALFYLEFTLHPNRQNPETQEVFTLFNKIGEIAEGSYGLIYMHDDDDYETNAFEVFVLSRGTIRKCSDPFLSPFVPTVEDEYM